MNKILDKLDYIIGGVAILALAAFCYGLGSLAIKNKVCNQIGGVYVSTFNGYRCIHATEIDL